MKKVKQSIEGHEIASVTFCWMQGERDAKMSWAPVYEKSLTGLYQQVCQDLEASDVGFIIGRLSDFDMQNQKYPHWTEIREIQVKVADSSELFVWIDTDDLNDGLNRKGKKIENDLHYSAEGYKTFGKRMAEAAIELVRNRE